MGPESKFSDESFVAFQTSGADASEMHQGLMPQERILLFLIMEISACTENPVIF